MTFDLALAEILKHEGIYVHDSRDPGGETKYGISKRAFPDLDIKSLTVADAAAIYRREYWNPICGDALPPALALCVFDTAVNMGVRQATILLQRAVGVKDDGAFGPRTLEAARRSGSNDLDDFMARRAKRYAELPTVNTFGRGWYRRLLSVHRTAIKMEN